MRRRDCFATCRLGVVSASTMATASQSAFFHLFDGRYWERQVGAERVSPGRRHGRACKRASAARHPNENCATND